MDDTGCSKGISTYSLGNIFSLLEWSNSEETPREVVESPSLKKIQNLTGFDPEEPNTTLKLNLTLLVVL